MANSVRDLLRKMIRATDLLGHGYFGDVASPKRVWNTLE